MADENVGRLSLEVDGDTAKLEEDIKKGCNKAEKTTTDTANKINAEAQKVSEKVGKVVGKVKSNAQSAGASVKATANSTADRIEAILNDTSRSEKSKVMAISSLYRKQGLTQSQAMAKAWDHIERTSKSGNKNIKKHNSEATQKILKNTEKIKSGCSKIGASISKIGDKFKGLGTTIATAFSVTAIASFTKSLTESSASVKALNSQFEQTFGNMQAQAEQALQTVAKNSGIVESRLQGVGTSIYAFAKTTGMDSTTALSMMQEALQVTADSAAYYDRSLEDTAESLKSFLKGNYENDAALGLSCTETTRNTAANKLYGKSFQDLSESQKQLTLLQMVKDANQLSGAMGQASREADGWENVTGNLKENWKQLLSVVGQPVLQVATQVVKRLSSALQTLTGYAQQAVDAMYKVFGWEKSDTSSALSSVSDSATENIEETTEANEKLKQSLAGFDKLNVMSQSETESDSGNSDTSLTPTTATDITSVIEVEEIDTSPLDDFYKKFENTFTKIKNLVTSGDFKGLGTMIAGKFNGLLDGINWTSIQAKATEWTTNITSFLNGAIAETDWFLVGSTLGEAINTAVISAFTLVTTFDWTGTGTALADIVNGWFDSIDWFLVAQTLSGALVGLLDTVIGFVKGVDWGQIGVAIGEFILGIDWWGLISGAVELIWNCIVGVWDLLVGLMEGLGVTEYWTNVALSAWEGVQNALSSVGQFFVDIWNGIKNTFVNIGNWFTDVFTTAWDGIKNAFSTTKQFFVDIWNGIKSAFSNVTNWFKNVFKNAWTAVKNVFSAGGKIFEGIKDSIASVFKDVVNGLIDGINNVIATPFNAINSALNTVRELEIAGWKPFDWLESIAVPQIPKLAKGGLIKAPTLALVGDNAGANTGNPEVVAPLNKLKGMLNESDGSAEDTAILSQILQYLIKIYEAITSDSNTNIIELIAHLDGDVLFKRMIQLNNQYKKRHGGKSAFA